ncbi:MAG: hypothetical protein H0W86_10535 [Armatimonadetes bacterium]|nr:hypothetical protein [Armatimonadota bacterium]
MTYQPNRLILESGHRLVVEHFARTSDMRLTLRPARKRLFSQEPKLPSLQVELNKPAFAAMVPEGDPDGKPYLVFETDPVSAGIRDLYRNADIPFIEADQAGGRGMLRFERPGFSAKLQFDDRGDATAVESILRWAETSSAQNKGKLIRNEVERTIASAIKSFADELGLATHHHVPFGYAAGYRPDLPRTIARHTIEMAVSIRPEVNVGAPVVMPIRVEVDFDSVGDPENVERDECVADFVCSVGMPMAAIQPGDNGKFRLTYSLADSEDMQLKSDDLKGWRGVMKDICSHALEVTNAGLTLSPEPT